ncbi:unnamed protein product [Boreogadus saida]
MIQHGISMQMGKGETGQLSPLPIANSNPSQKRSNSTLKTVCGQLRSCLPPLETGQHPASFPLQEVLTHIHTFKACVATVSNWYQVSNDLAKQNEPKLDQCNGYFLTSDRTYMWVRDQESQRD